MKKSTKNLCPYRQKLEALEPLFCLNIACIGEKIKGEWVCRMAGGRVRLGRAAEPEGGNMRKIKLFILVCCAVCAGCASSAVTTLHDETVTVSMVSSVAGMPFVKARRCEEPVSGESTVLDCRLSSLKSFPEFYSPGAVQEISSVLYE